MARMQVYLPDDLYELVKAHGLPASELLQKAVRAELHRLELLAETDRCKLGTEDPIDTLYGCLKDLSGDPLANLEAEHQTEIEADERWQRRSR